MVATSALGVGFLFGIPVASSAGAAPADHGATVLAVPAAVFPPGSTGNLTSHLNGVACPSPTNCVAVGAGGSPPISTRTLTESWNGTSWWVVPSPSPSGFLNGLQSVTCTGPDACLAVGSIAYTGDPYYGATLQTLVESWNGTAWSVVPSPDVPGTVDSLSGVSCTSATSCVAVGSYWPLDTYKFRTLIETWDGTAWSIVPGTGPAIGGYLTGVTCVDATHCTTVGTDNTGSTLALAGAGSAWSVVPTPNVPGADNVLSDVACTGMSRCTAVGNAVASATGQGLTLIETWDGTVWTIAPSPSPSLGPGGGNGALNRVTCPSPDRCVAVGFHFLSGGTGAQVTLVESWDGTSWSVVPSPNVSSTRNNLEGVWCASPSSCLTVGWYYNSIGDPGNTQTLVESWNGTTWTVVPSPNVDALVEPVVGMASTPAGDGYWLADSAGDVTAHGGARLFGSMSGQRLNAPITHVVATPDGGGYWLVAADGGIFAFGDASFHGSMGGKPLNAPVAALAATPSGHGYWLVAGDGGVFAFGDAAYRGSMGGTHLNRPVVGIVADTSTGGYWLVATDGGIFAFDAPFLGSTGDIVLNQPVQAMAPTADGGGYWFTASDGGVFAFGDAGFHGSMGGQPLNAPVVGMAADPSGGGYWLVATDGGIFSFDATFYGAG